MHIAPFGDFAREIPVGGVPLRVWQDELFRRFGLEVVRVEDFAAIPTDEARLVTYDNVFFTRRVLKSFLREWRGKASQLALPASSTFVRSHSDLQTFRVEGEHALYDFWGLPAGAPNDLRGAPLPVVFKEKIIRLAVPRTTTGVQEWVHPLTTSVCLHIRHWIHVLQANLLSVQIRWVDRVVTHPLWTAWALLRSGGSKWRLARVANRIGKRADIHPTALIEGSFIGDRVSIGPNALVRGSIIGDGSTLQEAVNVSFSVVGAGTFVAKHSIVYACAAFEEAELCMKGMQMCLVGRRAGLTARASPIDVSPGRKIRVLHEGKYPEIGLPLLGSCYGHDTFIGADVFIGPGRAIPNGVKIGAPPERVLSRIPEDVQPGRVYVVRNGTLEEP